MSETPHQTIHRDDYTPPDYLVDTVNLHFELDRALTRVTSRLTVRSNHDRSAGSRPLILDGAELKLLSLKLDGVTLPPERYRIEGEHLAIDEVPEAFVLEVATEICPEQNTALQGLYLSGPMLCTQCEAEGFRRITYFPDRPDVLSKYRVRMEGDAKAFPVLLSNGNRVAHGEANDGRHWAEWEDPFPKPCYLFALVAG